MKCAGLSPVTPIRLAPLGLFLKKITGAGVTWLLLTLLLLSTVAAEGWGYIQIDAMPEVEVFINDELTGVTGLEVQGLVISDVAAGEHTLRFEKEGFYPLKATLSVKDGRVTHYVLQPLIPNVRIYQDGDNSSGTLHATTSKLVLQTLPIQAVIQISAVTGEPSKTKDLWIVEELAAGSYTLSVSALGRTASTTITVAGNEYIRVFANLLNEPASIEVAVSQTSSVPRITEVQPSPVKSQNQRQWLQIIGSDFHRSAQVILYSDNQEYEIPADRTDYKHSGRIDVVAGIFPANVTWEVVVVNPGGLASEHFAFAVVD